MTRVPAQDRDGSCSLMPCASRRRHAPFPSAKFAATAIAMTD